jgi:hypothetical protein
MTLKDLKFRADISIFILLMLGMIIGLYLFGFQSAFQVSLSNTLSNRGEDPLGSVESFLGTLSTAIMGAFVDNISVTLPLLIFGSLAGIGGSSYASGSIYRFLFPIIILFAVINIFIFPVVPAFSAHVQSNTEWDPLVLILSVILNCMLFLTVIEFVKEG